MRKFLIWMRRIITGFLAVVISFAILIITTLICMGIAARIVMPIANLLHLGNKLRLGLFLISSVATFFLIWFALLFVVSGIPATTNLWKFCRKYYYWKRLTRKNQKARARRLEAYLENNATKGYSYYYRLALYAEQSGNLKEYEEYLLHAMTSINESSRMDLVPRVYSRLIKCCRMTKDTKRYGRYLLKFDKYYGSIPESAGVNIARFFIEVAYSTLDLNEFASAFRYALLALYWGSRNLGVLAEAFNLIGLVLAHCGDEVEAFKYFEASLATKISGDVRIKTLFNKAKCDLNAGRYSSFYEALDEVRKLPGGNQMTVVAHIEKCRAVVSIEVHAKMTMTNVYQRPVVRVIHKTESWDKARVLTSDDNVPELTQILEKAAADIAAKTSVAIHTQADQSPTFILQASLALIKKKLGPFRVIRRSVSYWSEAAAIEVIEGRQKFWRAFGKVAVRSVLPFLLIEVEHEIGVWRLFGYCNQKFESARATEETLQEIQERISRIQSVLRAVEPQLEVGISAILRNRLTTAYYAAQNALVVWSTECFRRTGEHRYRDTAWTALRWSRGYQLAEAIGFTDEARSRLAVETPAMAVLESCRQQVASEERLHATEDESQQFATYLSRCSDWKSPVFGPDRDSIEFIQSKLPRNVLWLICVIQGDNSFVWRVSHSKLEVSPLPSDELLTNVITKINEYISSQPLISGYEDSAEILQLCNQISRLILGNDVDLDVSRIIISPDGPCWNLPFEALPCPGMDGTALGSRYEIVWSVGNDNPYEEFYLRPAPERSRFALIGDPIYPLDDPRYVSDLAVDAGQRLGRLPFSADEIKGIEAVVKRSGPTKILTGRDVTISNIVECLNTCEIVHIACHAIDHDSDQMLCLSCITEDGRDSKTTWSREEISQNKFAARFVSLSACATATGRVKIGEGPYSLGRSFLASGVPSVLVTSWLISDEATAAFMRRFYAAVFGECGSITLSEGLRCAREAISREQKWRHPYFWACYRLMVSGVLVENSKIMPVSVDSKAFRANTN